MKNISVANMIEVLNLSLQAGFIDSPEEIDAVASIVSGATRSFEKECEAAGIHTDEVSPKILPDYRRKK